MILAKGPVEVRTTHDIVHRMIAASVRLGVDVADVGTEQLMVTGFSSLEQVRADYSGPCVAHNRRPKCTTLLPLELHFLPSCRLTTGGK